MKSSHSDEGHCDGWGFEMGGPDPRGVEVVPAENGRMGRRGAVKERMRPGVEGDLVKRIVPEVWAQF